MFAIFDLEFFGCRGSTPVSGAQFLKYGGSTTCIALYMGERLFVVDCGTGLMPLQAALFDTGRFSRADVFLTHIHWDHVQGIPFFGPLFSPACRFDFYGERRLEMGLQQQIGLVMTAPVFPVTMDAFHAGIAYHDIPCGGTLELDGVLVRTCRLRHPDVCTGYRFEWEGKSVCVAGDYEHGGEEPLELARDADVLVYDAQYTDREYEGKRGWGHSTWRKGCELAAKCGAKQLLLTHHDPWRTDAQLDEMEAQAREIFPGARFAAERLRVTV